MVPTITASTTTTTTQVKVDLNVLMMVILLTATTTAIINVTSTVIAVVVSVGKPDKTIIVAGRGKHVQRWQQLMTTAGAEKFRRHSTAYCAVIAVAPTTTTTVSSRGIKCVKRRIHMQAMLRGVWTEYFR